MVPHSLFVSSDRHADLALNLLTMVVGGALLATVAFLMFTWLRPGLPVSDRGDVGPPVWASMPDALLDPPRLEFDFQLPGLPAFYRCEHRGRVTYSDRPCSADKVRALVDRRS
ncbi:MAG: hypothetical protein ACXWVT_00475 [Burkholderiaceae bacterium]